MCLGGRDLDEILVDHCIEKFKQSTGVDLSLDKRARNRLQTSCETAKITLSTEFEATIRLLAIHQGTNFELKITRDEFEAKVQDTLERVKAPVRMALEEADLDTSEIKKVVLVGGSTRIPWIKAWLEEEFGFPPSDDLNADEGVAKGATMMAGILSGQFGQDAPVLQDLAPLTLGVRLVQDTVGVLIKRGTSIPCEH